MYKNKVFFFKTDNPHHNCLKIYNAKGDELSLSGDDSCGAFPHLSRTSLCIFPNGEHKMSEPKLTFVSPDDLLVVLAKHLGYKIKAVKKSALNPRADMSGSNTCK